MKIYQDDLERVCNEALPFERLKDKSILVSGANGLIGSGLIDVIMKLNEKFIYNIRVLALCRNKKKAQERFGEYYKNPLFLIIEGDVMNPLPKELRCDYIIHAASNAHPIAYATEPVETMKANLLGTIQLLEFALKNPIQRFMFISSSEIYGENISNTPDFNEDDCGYVNSMKERSCYPESKRAAETLCVSYDKQYNIDTVVARLGYVYGITVNENNTRADIQFMKQAETGQDIVLKSDGLQKRSYCYLSDVISGLLFILLQGKRREAYNIANLKSNITIRDFAYTLAEEAGVKVIFENPADVEIQGFSKIKNSVLNSAKLEALGWEARVDHKEGIHRLLTGRKEMQEDRTV